MISRLHKIDPFIKHLINEPVFISTSARPGAGAFVAERFGLSDAGEWIAHHGFDQLEDFDEDLSVVPGPKCKIASELSLKHQFSLPDSH